MPIYEYRCKECGFEKEYLQKLSDAPIELCEQCGKPSMGKLLSAAGFQLKGSGWYVTDFKNGGGKGKPANGESKEVAAGDSESKKGSSGEAGSKEGGTATANATTAPQCWAGACPACQ